MLPPNEGSKITAAHRGLPIDRFLIIFNSEIIMKKVYNCHPTTGWWQPMHPFFIYKEHFSKNRAGDLKNWGRRVKSFKKTRFQKIGAGIFKNLGGRVSRPAPKGASNSKNRKEGKNIYKQR
jgi:hypothetical protein